MTARTPATTAKIRVGISRCLMGDAVRYDGGHQLDRYIVQTLGRHLEFVPVCPEVECGLPVPREAMRLEGDPLAPRLVTRNSRTDLTDQMLNWAARRVEELAAQNLSGFIFKSRSPSSGMERVKVYPAGGKGLPKLAGVGLFAGALMKRLPHLPVEEDGRLHDVGLRENFLERLAAADRWNSLPARFSLGELVAFHTRHKLQIMAHSPRHYRLMGTFVAQAKDQPPHEVRAQYLRLFMEALTIRATPSRHCNVLQHVLGYFKKQISPDEKQECLEIIERYRAGDTPLLAPVTLLNHYVRKYGADYLGDQFYLYPHPVEVRLRAGL